MKDPFQRELPTYGCYVQVPDNSFGIDQIVKKALADHPTMKLFNKREKEFNCCRLQYDVDDRRIYLVCLRPRSHRQRSKDA